MQRRYTTLVERVRIRAGFDQIGDHVTLCQRIPVLRAGTSIGGVVERLSSPSVTSSHIGALSDEQLGGISLMRGCGDMQGRVAGVNVVTDRNKEVPVGTLAARPNANRAGHEITP